jgi:hypothetical protein
MKRLCKCGGVPKIYRLRVGYYWVECDCGLKTILYYSRYRAWREWEAMQREEVERG